MGGTGVGTAKRRGRRLRRLWIVGAVVGAVTATGLGTAPAVWATSSAAHPKLPVPKDHFGATAKPLRPSVPHTKDPAAAAAKRTADLLKKPVVWPTSADATVTVPAMAAASATSSATADAAGITVTVAPHADATAAGISGALLTISRRSSAEGKAAKVSLDYSGFANAYGGDFGPRLTLVQLPLCALTTPQKAACRTRTPLSTDNNIKAKTLTASVPAAKSAATSTVLLAADAAPTSGAGSYQATSMAPSGSWSGGGESGDFTWSYPLSMPPAAGGPAPTLSIDYDAQSVDGRLPSTNNQPSWIGEGFDLGTSYIERSYDSCDDDGQSGKYDECWAGDNATLVLNGKSSPLIKSQSTGEWHPKDDDGERVAHCTNADTPATADQHDGCTGGATNGDNDGEFWIVTTTDGTQYYFGKDRLPGWTSGQSETNSALTVPVYGDDANEPCHASTFAASSCTQAWRWNLDFVVDTHHNAMSYWYTKETNAYGQNGTTTATGTTYDRNAYLSRIDYGITDSTVFGTAPEQVNFSTAERCLPVDGGETCGSLTSTTAKDWPDVPFDQICAPGTVCKNSLAPTFFSRKRLTGVSTRVWDTTLSTPGYQNVDSWALDQDFVDPGDGTSSSLWLKSITHTGEDGTALAMPPVTFEGRQLPNRVDTSHDDIAALIKWRVNKITTETGDIITVNYNDNDPTGKCVAGTSMPAAPDDNTMLCYPVMWTPPLMADPQLDYFHKYVVDQVVETDTTGDAPNKETDYTYADPAWHYDSDNVTSPAKDKTWSVWRGFGLVTTTTGDAQTTRTKSVDTYFQGMDGDKQSDGSTRSATVVDSNGTHVTDSDQLAGQERESRTFNGSDEVSSSITDEWSHATGSDGTRSSYFVRPSTVTTRTDRTSGTPRTTKVTTTYDDGTGAATKVDDAGDVDATGDEQCTRTAYANNDSSWLRVAPIDVETVDVACGATTTRPDDVVSDVRSLYDNHSYGTAPTVGDVTSTQRVSSYSGGNPVYQTVSTSTYDSQGRVLSVADAEGNTSTTAYTPTTGGPVTSTVTKNAKQYATTTTYDPTRNLATDVVDANGKHTDYSYDSLGRLTAVWLPSRSQSAGQKPNLTYDYELSKTAAYVRTGKVRNDGTSYNYTYEIYDSLLRPRQTQVPASNGGRVFTETKYDSRGLAVEADADYADAADPSGTLDNLSDPDTGVIVEPSQTVTTYDGAGRPTLADFYANGVYKWSTTTVYGGDRTTVIPPNGGIATTTLTDALGRTTETRQYDDGTASGSYSSIKYQYNDKSQLTQVTDAGGNVWTYGYDLMGRQTSSTDPDAGYSTTRYDDLDQVVSTTDNRSKTISYTYDELGRATGEFGATVEQQSADNQLAGWTYDSVAKGQPTSSTRYVGGSGTSGKAYVSQVSTYDSMYRPTLTKVTIPSVPGEEALAKTYSSASSYNLDDTTAFTTDPAVGGLSAESFTYGYNSLGMPTSLTNYVQSTHYTALGQVAQINLGINASAPYVQEGNDYEAGTDRLTRQLVTDGTSGVVADTHYGYDAAGNPTMTDAQADGVDDTQCYRYDGHDRLTAAFTTSNTWQTPNTCGTDPTSTNLGSGPAPYWQSYTYDVLGNRKQLVQHGTSSGAPDTTTTYAYGATDGTQPHTLTGSTTTKPGSPDQVNVYGYDSAGNTTSRNLNGASQSMAWDDEGHLQSDSTSGGSSVSYLYDADGNRLLTRDDTGTTLYLGDTEVHLAKGTTSVTATRYYTWAGQTIAERSTGGTLQWVLDDAHDTATTQIDATTQAVQRRRTDPFGNDRGTAPTSWTGDHGFVGGVEDDTTGLTHLGARDYDPTVGRFISLDPVLELTDPQQINGYSYAADNPITGADPTGLMNYQLLGGACDTACEKANSTDTTSSKPKHHSCGWSFTCHAKSAVHSVTKVVEEHPVIAAVVATAVVAGAVACVVATAGACAGVLVAGAEGFTAGAEMGTASAAVLSSATAVLTASGEVAAGEVAAASAAAGIVTEAAETAGKEDAAASAGADAAASSADDTASSGSSSGAKRASTAAPKSGATKGRPGCSFAPQTPVLLADGKTKPIGQLQIGDKVQSADPATGKHVGPETVTATLVNHDHDLADVTVRGKDGKPATLHTTANHPFYDATTHKWTPAGKLKPGHALVTDKSHHVTIVAVHATQGTANRFNLTVQNLHTYYVLAGNTPVLVHNTCGDPVSPAFEGDPYHPDEVQQRIDAGRKAWEQIPREVHNTVNGIESGRVTQRISGGTPDWFKANGNTKSPWYNATIFTGVKSPTTLTRVLVRSDGVVGYVLGHNYNNVIEYGYANLIDQYVPKPE